MTTETTPTTAITALNATEEDVLDLSQPQLLGLFGGAEGSRALLRSADGTILTAAVSDTTPIGEVIVITDTYVLLRTEDATIRRLTMPS